MCCGSQWLLLFLVYFQPISGNTKLGLKVLTLESDGGGDDGHEERGCKYQYSMYASFSFFSMAASALF